MVDAGIDPVRAPGEHGFATIDWKKDIKNTKADEFVMQCFPVSRLPRDPSGRLQTVQEYVQAGFMSSQRARRELDFPDLDSSESLATSQEDMAIKVLDGIIDDGEYTSPEPTDDLRLFKEMTLGYIQRYRLLGLEDEKLAMLRQFNAQLDTLTQASQPPPMAPDAGLAAPQARPDAPPVSDMLPNAPGHGYSAS
jgi:hypothetical protein